MFSETIELRGHFIDSLTLPKVLDQIVTRGAAFNIVEFMVGQKRVDQSFARIEVTARTKARAGEATHFASCMLKHGFQITWLRRDDYFEGEGDELFVGATLFCGYP